MGRFELERVRVRGMESGRFWDRSSEILLLGGLVVLGIVSAVAVAVVVVREAEDCWLVGEVFRLEFLLFRVEKSIRLLLFDFSCFVFLVFSSEGGSFSTFEERMWRRSCLRLCEVIWLVEVKVKS